jgi:3'(2'), 5'-bisphosphate nucleotidase
MKYNLDSLIKEAIIAALSAGREILAVYGGSSFEVEFKSDNSPLTIADKKAHKIISQKLEKTGIPLLSEESRTIPFEQRKTWDIFWLIDPLDGTKEFIKRNGEFTVNIALIQKNRPVLGVIFAPVLKKIYFGYNKQASVFENIDLSKNDTDLLALIQWNSVGLPIHSQREEYIVVASRSHLSEETKEFVDELDKEKGNIKMASIGSSLKLCLIAEGKADIYPRYAPTMEWDTAAGHAIVEAAGGVVLEAYKNSSLIYNKENQLNPWFIARIK